MPLLERMSHLTYLRTLDIYNCPQLELLESLNLRKSSTTAYASLVCSSICLFLDFFFFFLNFFIFFNYDILGNLFVITDAGFSKYKQHQNSHYFPTLILYNLLYEIFHTISAGLSTQYTRQVRWSLKAPKFKNKKTPNFNLSKILKFIFFFYKIFNKLWMVNDKIMLIVNQKELIKTY